MKVHLGIDPASTRIAYVALADGGSYLLGFNKKLGKSGGEACAAVWRYVNDAVDTIYNQWPSCSISAFIESPVVGVGGVRSTMVQCFTSGAIQGSLYERGIESQVANVSSWKKHVVGKGNATKEEVAEYIRRGWPALFREANGNQDIYDAACIALFGRQKAT
jgi:Holliday junction resolvasome RuvABC endonuclease subunit